MVGFKEELRVNLQSLGCRLFAMAWLAQPAWAEQASTHLDAQITLIPACRINQGTFQTSTGDVNLGVFDFGRTQANFKQVETGLVHANGAGLSIECPAGVNAQVVFGAGLHDANVPTLHQGQYYHALNYGQSYIAYNLYVDASKQKVIVPHEPIKIPSGQVFHLLPHAQAVGNDNLTQGLYTDTLAVTISF